MMFIFNLRLLNCFCCLVFVQFVVKNGIFVKVVVKKIDEFFFEEEDSGDESEEEVKVSVDFMINYLIILCEQFFCNE